MILGTPEKGIQLKITTRKGGPRPPGPPPLRIPCGPLGPGSYTMSCSNSTMKYPARVVIGHWAADILYI